MTDLLREKHMKLAWAAVDARQKYGAMSEQYIKSHQSCVDILEIIRRMELPNWAYVNPPYTGGH